MQTTMTAEKIVQASVNAYNNRDIDTFIALFSDNISLFNQGSPEPSFSGPEAIYGFYSALFNNSPNLHSTILQRIVIGNTVIDHESITGRNGEPNALTLALIYEIENDKIARITVIQES